MNPSSIASPKSKTTQSTCWIATMIGNGKFEPLTLWNDIELRYRITASQWTS